MPDAEGEPESGIQFSEPLMNQTPQDRLSSPMAKALPHPHLQVLLDVGESNEAIEDLQSMIPEQCDEAFITACCAYALRCQSQLDLSSVSDMELSVQLLDTESMRALNLQYRQKNSPTNVLSFASAMPVMAIEAEDAGESGVGGLLVLGDLVLCPEVLAREAIEQAKLLPAHWMHMLVHGVLHLCGYDHQEEVQAQVMEALEIRILLGLGIANPYELTKLVANK